ncbi:MAG: sigma-54-dependent Fis family transcriptional regulator [Chloroflexi bacterium]|nr:sigma-54-dependent Fis family transcriptional regulator [Chloroflexota bacterium]
MKRKVKVLVVDDEAIIRESLRDWLRDAGHEVLIAEDGHQALTIIEKERPCVAIVDLVMPGMDGIELLKKAKEICPAIEVVIITAYGSVPTAITAMREGAYDYIEKPFCPERAELLIDKLAERQQLLEENLALHQKLEERFRFENIIAKSPRMQQVIEVIKVVARSNATVLITGESGTGKELVARAVHTQSQRKDRPFVAVSCAALPESLLESELFGHEKGAFTGAHIQRRGKFEAANRGTLFLDEIGEMSANIQVHLLRVLEEKEFARVGGNEPIKVDVRIISATNKDMKKAIAAGQFREDLYYRLNVVNVELPPLRERKEDIPLLVQHFLKNFAEENKKPITGFSNEATDFLLKYEWPGNVRELENAVERAVILAKGPSIEVADLAQENLQMVSSPLRSLKDVERECILNVLSETGRNYSQAARILGISRVTLYNKIRDYGLNL